ncbi:MAG: hypothetical protein IV100_31335 [Myxococcales bacterium]|nr:hypothetical protein [Myxococcales bacterium]
MLLRLGCRRASGALTLVVALAGAPTVAWAAPPPPSPEVKALYDAGRHFFEKRRYDEAAARFADAARLDPRPGLLHNQALALEKAGRLAEAVTAVAAFEARTEGRERESAARWRETMERRLSETHGLLTLSPTGVYESLRVGDVVMNDGASRWWPAGALVVRGDAPGYDPEEHHVVLDAGERRTLTLAPRPRAAGPATAARASRRGVTELSQAPRITQESERDPTLSVPLLATGGALLGLGALLHLGVALPLAYELEAVPAGPEHDGEFDEGASTIEGLQIGAFVSYGLGAAFAIAGIVMMSVEDVAPVDVLVGPGTVGLRGRF